LASFIEPKWKIEEIEMTTALDTSKSSLVFAAVDWRNWTHAYKVLNDPGMSTDQKKALLRSWVAESNAVPYFPSIRRLQSGQLVLIDDVAKALATLDALQAASSLDSTELHRFSVEQRAAGDRYRPAARLRSG
jgi:hypothetical protein